jgi:hypothetical protein
MQCKNENCRVDVPIHFQYCPVCGTDAGFPNVRIAEQQEEIQALDQRYNSTRDNASERKCVGILDIFDKAVSESKAILCKPLSIVMALASNDNQLYTTYYNQLYGSSRIPEENDYDGKRQSIDSALYPVFYKDICYTALSLDGKGVELFGECSIALKDMAVCKRATVFEENSFDFYRNNRLLAGDSPQPGHRATWVNRSRLAVVKLSQFINTDTKPSDFPPILLNQTNKSKPDFIEVHIFGPIHRRSIEKILIRKPRRRPDQILLKGLEERLSEIGAVVETY